MSECWTITEVVSAMFGAYGLGWLCCFSWMRTSADALDDHQDDDPYAKG